MRRQRKPAGRQPLIALLFALLALTAGCSLIGGDGGGNLTLGTEAVLLDQGVLVCSQVCLDRGQCGTADTGPMVLLSSARPVVTGHDIASAVDTQVAILQQQMETVVEISTNREFEVPYYLVDVPGRGPAWVAGWCVGQ